LQSGELRDLMQELLPLPEMSTVGANPPHPQRCRAGVKHLSGSTLRDVR
jgi:hypothetical protein